MGKCSVVTCSSVNDKKTRNTDLKFYKFPSNVKLRRQWVTLCGRNVRDFSATNAVVCSNHFPEDKRHTLQCRLLGTLGIKTRIKCVCRIPEGEVPSLELPESKDKSKLAVKLAQKLEAEKEKARKELVEELLRSSSYGDETQASTVVPASGVKHDAVALTSESSAELVNLNKRKAAGPEGALAAKRTAGKPAATTTKKIPFILPKYTEDNPMMVTLLPTCDGDDIIEVHTADEVPAEIFTQQVTEDSETTLSDFECTGLEQHVNVEEVVCETGDVQEQRMLESPLNLPEMPGMPGHVARLEDMCRMCSTPGEDMTYIFSEEGRRAQLKHKINHCMPITVSEEDSLPLVVCKVCILRLELSYKLAATCQQTDFKLKKIQRKLAKHEQSGISALNFCTVEVGDSTLAPSKPVKTTKQARASKAVKLVKKIASNKLPVLCKLCHVLLCTTNDAVNHYLKLHDKSACEFCFEYFDDNGALVFHLNSKHIHACKYCTFKIIGLGEKILTNHVKNFHLKSSFIKSKLLASKRAIVKRPFIMKRGPEKCGIYACKICSLLYSSRLSLRNHYENVHKIFICMACFVDFKSKEELDFHVAENFHDIICKQCNREFSSNRGLQNHVTLVHKPVDRDETEYECKDCNSVFVSKRNQRRHYLRVHYKYACPICDSILETKEDLDSHVREMNHYCCEPCEIEFSSQDSYEYHLISHSKGTDFKCQTCEKIFTSRNGLKNHIKYLHLNVPYKYPCKSCDKKYKSPKKLHQHMKRHKNEKNIKCGTCDKLFYDTEALKIHSRVHVSEKKYVCDLCGAKFTHQRNLSAHILGVHTAKWTFTCNECKFVTRDEEEIGAHCRTHQNNVLYARTSPYHCEECNKYFANKLYCLTHIRNHKIIREKGAKPVERPFECNLCLKRFQSKQLLRKHLGTHVEVKPFNCTICPRGFMEERDLEVHMRLHTNVKPFVCNICEKAFHKKTNLTVHRRNVHQSVKKIQCPHCDKMFKRNQQLVIHIRVHTKEKPFSCDVCDQRFTQRGDMMRHRLRHDTLAKLT